MLKLKKGSKLVCAPCGREIIVDACGASNTTIWCCDKPMRPKAKKSKAKKVIKNRAKRK